MTKSKYLISYGNNIASSTTEETVKSKAIRKVNMLLSHYSVVKVEIIEERKTSF